MTNKNKRVLIVEAMVVCLISVTAAAQGTGSGTALNDFQIVDAGAGIVAFVAPETTGQLVSGNSVAIIGDHGVLVVDTGHFPPLTRKMIAEIRRRTPQPVRYVINTHWHDDHTTGNSVYKDEFPGVSIISTPDTKRNADQYNPEFIKLEQQAVAPMITRLSSQLAAGKNAAGDPLTTAKKEEYESLRRELAAFQPMLPTLRYEGPNVTFTDQMDIFLGQRRVRIMFLGKGNTAGDAVVYVPDARVLITGDLVVMPVPFATTSFLPEWIQVLGKLQEFDAAVIVPGHGPLLHDFSYLKWLQNTLETIVRQVETAIHDSKSLEQTIEFVRLDAARNTAVGTNLVRGRNWDQYFARPAVENAFKELKGIAIDENPFAPR